MKTLKSFLWASLSLFVFTANAQDEVPTDLNTLQFVDANGNIVSDGTTLTLSDIEETPEGIEINSGLSVKNTTSDDVYTCANIEVLSIDNGEISSCFPSSCNRRNHVGSFSTQTGSVSANSTTGFQTEWIPESPESYGACTAIFQIQLYRKVLSPGSIGPKYEIKAYGPKVNVNFIYSNPTNINGIKNDEIKAVAFYNINGQQIVNPKSSGLTIVKLSNGKTVKMLQK